LKAGNEAIPDPMSRASIPLLLFCLPLLVHAQDSTCIQDFRTGTFTYKEKQEEVEVIRTRSTQIERYNDGDSELVLSIEWPDDSSYVLTLQRSINAPGCLEKGDTIRTQVLSCEKGRMTGRSSSEDCGGQRFVMLKKEE
jgi:hypothetical protein